MEIIDSKLAVIVLLGLFVYISVSLLPELTFNQKRIKIMLSLNTPSARNLIGFGILCVVGWYWSEHITSVLTDTNQVAKTASGISKLEWLKTSPIARIIMVYTMGSLWYGWKITGRLNPSGIIIIFNWLVMFIWFSLRLCIAAYAGVVVTPVLSRAGHLSDYKGRGTNRLNPIIETVIIIIRGRTHLMVSMIYEPV